MVKRVEVAVTQVTRQRQNIVGAFESKTVEHTTTYLMFVGYFGAMCTALWFVRSKLVVAENSKE